LLYIYSFGQNVQVFEKNSNYNSQTKSKTFNHINNKFNIIVEFERIAILKGYTTNSNKHTLFDLFNDFQDTATNFGANSFIVDDVISNADTTVVQISIYSLSDSAIESNFDLYPENMIYIFGDLNKNKKGRTFKLNGQKLTLLPMQYISYQNKSGEYAKISIGGFTGASRKIKGEEGRLPNVCR
jgi:hypothetical protein